MISFLTIFTFLGRYFKDFQNPEVLEQRYEMMTTVFLSIFIYSGFKPLFHFFNNIIFFVKDLIFGLFFKSNQQVLLEQKRMEKARQHQELVLKSEQNYQELKQIKTELEKINKKEKREEKKGKTSDEI
ncbi:MAG: hypothetical protein Q8831_02180 ['Bonamia sp.' little leaf phytoplasma]|nr:hypothetical protein ['Bonamia sp.' little leaf phytoplasma]MDV3174829.1 hypothetical protein ['Bonamia sp.' little leaf phytoplasma]